MKDFVDLGSYRSRKDLARAGRDMKQHMLLAVDLTETGGAKQYIAVHLDEMDRYLGAMLAKNYHFYELLVENEPVKPYFDCEIEREGLDPADAVVVINDFVQFLIREFANVFAVDLTDNDFILLDSSRANKLSYHIVINTKVYFRHVKDHALFKDYLWGRFAAPRDESEKALFDSLSWVAEQKGGVKDVRRIFDPAVYCKDQVFRLPNQSKKGKTHLLKNCSAYPDTECVIRLYWGVGDRKLLNADALVAPKFKKVRVGEPAAVASSSASATTAPAAVRGKPAAQKKAFAVPSTDVTFQTEGTTLHMKHQMKYEDVRQLQPEYMRYLYLIPNTTQSYQFYRDVAFALRGAGGTLEQFKQWAALYTGFDKNCPMLRQFAKLRGPTEEATYGMPFLKRHAKLAHPDYFFQEPDQLVDDFFKPNFDSIRIIEEDCPFVSMQGTPHARNILAPEKVLIVQAFLGCGKTTAISTLMRTKQYDSVLVLSPRIAYSCHVTREFGVRNYLDFKHHLAGLHDQTKLVISMESLHKIHPVQQFQLVIIDECEANLSVFGSSTMKGNHTLVYKTLCRIIDHAEKVVFAGAFITNLTTNFVRSLNIPAVCIRNSTPPQRRTAQEIPCIGFEAHCIAAIKSGKKLFVCWSSCTQLKAFDAIVQIAEPAVYARRLLYQGNGDDTVFIPSLINIGETWGAASLVMCSPAVTIGNSYAPKTADFHECCIKGYPTCLVTDTFQSHMRVRHLIDNMLRFSLPSKFQLAMCAGKFAEVDFGTLDEFDAATLTKKNDLIACVRKWDAKKDKKFNFATEEVLQMLTVEYTETPRPLREMMLSCVRQSALSGKFYRQMFIRTLEFCNYDVQLLAENDDKKPPRQPKRPFAALDGVAVSEEKKASDIAHFMSDECDTEYDTVREISDVTCELLKSNIEMKRASIAEKQQVNKYFFDRAMVNPIPPHYVLPLYIRREYYRLWTDTYTKKIVKNALAEKEADVENAIYDIRMENRAERAGELIINGVENMDQHALRLDFILQTNAALGISHSLLPVDIPRSVLEALAPALHADRARIHRIFELRDKSAPVEASVKASVALLDKVYRAWTGAGLTHAKAADKRRQTQEMYRKNVLTCAHPLVAEYKVPLPPPFRPAANEQTGGGVVFELVQKPRCFVQDGADFVVSFSSPPV